LPLFPLLSLFTHLPSLHIPHSHFTFHPLPAISGHETKNVWDELLSLCLPYVTNSSYCIVEDTVLGTPFDALRVFFSLQESADFCIDGDREYFGISQHRGGYLKRIDTSHKAPFPKEIIARVDRVFNGNRTVVRGGITQKNLYERKKLEEAVEQVYHQGQPPSLPTEAVTPATDE
jgi:hypothetical protein